MVYTARIDLAPFKHVAIVGSVTIIFMIAAVILGQTGPSMMLIDTKTAYNCPDGSHTQICPGGKELGKQWSDRMVIETRQLNKQWYCVVTPFASTNNSLGEEVVKIYTTIEGRKFDDPHWSLVFNGSELSLLPCINEGQDCIPFVLLYEENILYDFYGVTVRFTSSEGYDLLTLGDVEFDFVKDNPEFSKMALILKVLFLGLSIGLFAFHYLKLKGNKSYWDSWTDEQRLFVFLLVSLVGFNNPFFPLEYIAKGWFLPFLGSFLELLFCCVLFAFWFIVAQKLRSAENKITFSVYLKAAIVLVVIYAILTVTFYGLVSSRDEQSPLYGIDTTISPLRVMYFISAAFYVAIVILFFATLVITVPMPADRRVQLRARFAFFGIPTIYVIISVLVGLFLGILGPYGRDAPSFVYFLVMYNLYVYVLLWGYWPIEASLGTDSNKPDTPTEGTKMFVQATQPNYTIV